jgi:TusA-related sulfurtransferase
MSEIASFGDAADHFSSTLQVCYEILLYLNSRMVKLQPGEVLEFTTTDPGAQDEIPQWCELRGYTLLAREQVAAQPEPRWQYLIRK